MDVWSVMHPRTKDFTHYSQLHCSYSRIDYFFIEHHHLSLHSKIDTSTISDHAPICLRLKIPSLPLKTTNWKLNDSIISEDIDKKLIGDDFSLYFKENMTPEISPGVLWEAHKAHIRGKRIELSSRKKRERTHLQSELIREIGSLERNHKTLLFQTLYHSLTLKREELKALFHSEQKK